MSALGDALNAQTKEFVQDCTINISIDGADIAGAPTYSVKMSAPGVAQTVLGTLTAVEVGAAVTEFTDWVTAQWPVVTP